MHTAVDFDRLGKSLVALISQHITQHMLQVFSFRTEPRIISHEHIEHIYSGSSIDKMPSFEELVTILTTRNFDEGRGLFLIPAPMFPTAFPRVKVKVRVKAKVVDPYLKQQKLLAYKRAQRGNLAMVRQMVRQSTIKRGRGRRNGSRS